MLNREQQERLTRIGPGTAAGRLFRHYWMPIRPTCDLVHGQSVRIRLLGEDLVLFRDLAGKVGLIDEHCPHRRSSLALGCVDEEGIRCPYHGWKFNRHGSCLEIPTESAESNLSARVKTTAYPVKEMGGLIFAYLGPAEPPQLPHYDLFVAENCLRDIGYAMIPCNWLQIMENSVDPYHLEWLHGHHLAHSRRQQGLEPPTHYRRKQTKIGFDVFEHGIIKRRVLEGGSEQDDDWRIGHPLVFPNVLRVGTGRQHRFQIRVPVDDTHTLHFWYSCYQLPNDHPAAKQTTIPSYEVPFQDEEGNFLVHFVDGQDIMAWVTQGAIADRTREYLVEADKGIILYRQLLSEQIDRVERNERPLGWIDGDAKVQLIELPQEREKFGAGDAFLAESLAMSHVAYSPLREQILELLRQ